MKTFTLPDYFLGLAHFRTTPRIVYIFDKQDFRYITFLYGNFRGRRFENFSIQFRFLCNFFCFFHQMLFRFFCNYRFRLRIRGSGFFFRLVANQLILLLGYSHAIHITVPMIVRVRLIGRKKRFFRAESYDYNSLQRFVHLIRSFRLPDCYNEKGIKFRRERVRRKTGKKKFV